MLPALHFLRRVLALALALGVASGLALAADEKKPETKKAADPKAADPKPADKDAKPATNAVPLVVPFPKSVFNTSVETGKDPFFPSSKRRLPKPSEAIKPLVTNATNTTQIVVVSTNVPPHAVTNQPLVVVKVNLIGAANLSLRGITTSKTRRLAEIHTGVKGYTFIKGDTMLIRLPNEKELKVQCLDIRERSAIFRAEGETETIELFLREGL